MPVKSYLPIFEGGGGGTRGEEVGTLDQSILGNGSKVVASLGVVFSKVTRAKLRHYG